MRRGNARDGAPHITVSGNREFVPAWFANPRAVVLRAAPAAPAVPSAATPADPGAVSLRRVPGTNLRQGAGRVGVAGSDVFGPALLSVEEHWSAVGEWCGFSAVGRESARI